jgi:hypothetical protein
MTTLRRLPEMAPWGEWLAIALTCSLNESEAARYPSTPTEAGHGCETSISGDAADLGTDR